MEREIAVTRDDILKDIARRFWNKMSRYEKSGRSPHSRMDGLTRSGSDIMSRGFVHRGEVGEVDRETVELLIQGYDAEQEACDNKDICNMR